MKPDENSHIFIVRIWWETRDIDNQPEFWRGKVEYLNRRTHKFFANFDDLMLFIDEHIHAAGERRRLPAQEPLRIKVRRWFKNLTRSQ